MTKAYRLRESEAFSIASEKAATKGLRVVSWGPKGFEGHRSTLLAECAEHGQVSLNMDALRHQDSGCPKCGKRRAGDLHKRPRSEVEDLISLACVKTEQEYLGFSQPYINGRTLVKIRCPSHGVRHISVNAALGARRCPRCVKAEQRSPSYRTEEVASRLARRILALAGLEFLGWETTYKQNRSYLLFRCPQHGEFRKSLLKLQQGGRCPGCAKGGFDPSRTGYVYLIKSVDGAFIKVGITNSTNRRFCDLVRATPFPIFPYGALAFQNGRQAQKLEKHLLRKYERAGLAGFDGATEWLKASPELINEFLARI